jgi:hypothetical protein
MNDIYRSGYRRPPQVAGKKGRKVYFLPAGARFKRINRRQEKEVKRFGFYEKRQGEMADRTVVAIVMRRMFSRCTVAGMVMDMSGL